MSKHQSKLIELIFSLNPGLAPLGKVWGRKRNLALLVGRAGRNNVLLHTNWFSFGSFEIQIDNSEQQAEFNNKTLQITV